MYTRFPAYAFPLVGLMLLGSLACNSSVAPTSPDATSSPVSVSLKAEPNALQAEMLHDNGCNSFRPFGVGLTLVLNARERFILRRLIFRFRDQAGVDFFPDVFPSSSALVAAPTSSTLPSLGTGFPSSSPVPIPGATVIPLPGNTSMHGLFVNAGSSPRLPYFLRFGCGVRPHGMLTIDADFADGEGRLFGSDLKLPLGH